MMRDKTEIFKAISEPSRVRILMMLLQKKLCVCEITHILGLSTATASNHLSLLRDKGFIEDEKQGKWINYMIADNPKDPIVKQILTQMPLWFGDDDIIQNDLKQIATVDRMVICCS